MARRNVEVRQVVCLLASAPLFIQFWEAMLPKIERNAPKFAKYFKSECLRRIKTDDKVVYLALWWGG